MTNPSPLIRLNKFLAERLGISRREADELILAGRVAVNGRQARLGERVDKDSKICYNGKIVPFETRFSYLALHKPVGYVCSRRAQGAAPTIYDLLPEKYRKLKTVGRLDKDSSGLILFTDDGDFAFRMTHPKFHKTKIYEVELDHSLKPLHQQMISDYGVLLDDGPSKFTVVRDGDKYIVTLTEGRNRQIRRTFASLGYKVTKLHRICFGVFELNDLPIGKYQVVDEKEIRTLV
ncbi:rRNA pseudouridine synthase [Candidatus Saccharibacteria bacterium]|nr:rRNA pseudouridine synthase [Candidatus Saccharibacteria bacterium]